MVRFTIRILVYTLVLAITITFAPGINIQPLVPGVVDISATYLIFGILFGIINALIRPLVLLFTAKLIDGVEAERIGLVNQAVPPGELDDAVWAMTRDVARTAEVGLRISKLATNRWYENMGLLASCYSTADLDTFFHQSPTYVEFFQTVRERGMQAALSERQEKYG